MGRAGAEDRAGDDAAGGGVHAAGEKEALGPLGIVAGEVEGQPPVERRPGRLEIEERAVLVEEDAAEPGNGRAPCKEMGRDPARKAREIPAVAGKRPRGIGAAIALDCGPCRSQAARGVRSPFSASSPVPPASGARHDPRRPSGRGRGWQARRHGGPRPRFPPSSARGDEGRGRARIPPRPARGTGTSRRRPARSRGRATGRGEGGLRAADPGDRARRGASGAHRLASRKPPPAGAARRCLHLHPARPRDRGHAARPRRDGAACAGAFRAGRRRLCPGRA